MELRGILNGLSYSEVRERAIELEINGAIHYNDESAKHFLIKNIVAKLTSLDFLEKLIKRLDAPSIITLSQLVYYEGCTINANSLEILKKKGLIYNGKQVPDDVKIILQECLYPKIRKQINKKWEIRQTPFLNLIILAGLLQRDEISVTKTKKNVLRINIRENKKAYQFFEQDRLKLLIQCLETQGVVHWEEARLCVDHIKLITWIKKDNQNKFQLLYGWLNSKFSKVFNLMSALSKVQVELEDWINMDIFIDISLSKDSLENFGLISITKIEDHYYARLTPEGWYYTKGVYPDYWYNQIVLISADFEVFVPYNFDPNLINLLEKYGILKDNDYFLVYDIDPANLKKELLIHECQNYQAFIHELKLKSIAVPQVVDYELNNFLGELAEYLKKPIMQN